MIAPEHSLQLRVQAAGSLSLKPDAMQKAARGRL